MWTADHAPRGVVIALGCLLLAAAPVSAQVTTDMLAAAADHPGNWMTYSGQYDGQRFSRLTDINRDTVGDLQLGWVRQLDTLGQVQTSPLVVDGVMYVTTPENEVLALDAATGQVFWSYIHPLEEALTLCCGKQSRGLAILGDTLYLATMDAHLVALDAATGERRLGHRRGAAPRRLQHDGGPAGGEQPGHHRHRRRRVRHPRLRGRVRRPYRRTPLAPLHDSGRGRAGERHLGRRLVEDRRRLDLAGSAPSTPI